LLFLYASPVKAQTPGKVEVIKDPRIDTLILRRMEAARSGRKSTGSSNNSTAAASGTFISSNGFRVQIFSGSGRANAYAAQSKFIQKFPDIPTYITYEQPNFKVRAGDFRTRIEAAKMMNELKPLFPNMYIVAGKINPPKL
jgi:hypothetical protein